MTAGIRARFERLGFSVGRACAAAEAGEVFYTGDRYRVGDYAGTRVVYWEVSPGLWLAQIAGSTVCAVRVDDSGVVQHGVYTATWLSGSAPLVDPCRVLDTLE
jgi:hypothetical protein